MVQSSKNRVTNPETAMDQAYAEDFQHSMQKGKEPAFMQHTRTDVANIQANYEKSLEMMKTSYQFVSPDSSMSQEMTAQEAQEVLQDVSPIGKKSKSTQKSKNKKPSLFTRALTSVTSPFVKARAASHNWQKANLEKHVNIQQERLAIKQAEMQKYLDAQRQRDEKREAFKNSIRDSAQSVKDSVTNAYTQTGEFVNGAIAKGKSIPLFVSEVIKVAQERMQEQEIHSKPVEKEEVIKVMSERMKEKSYERTQFNEAMLDMHGKDVGNRPLEVASENNREEANQMAHLETKEFISRDTNNQMVVDRNPAFYQYMLDMHSEDAIATAGDNGIDFEDKAQELYDSLLEERNESQASEELNKVLMESYESSYPSKRLRLYMAKNPSLTGVDEGLTKASAKENKEFAVEAYETVMAESEYDSSFSIDDANTPKTNPFNSRREQSINKEFNDVDISHEGYIDLNQESEKVIHLETARMQRQGSVAAVAGGKPDISPDLDALKDVFRAESKYTKNAILQRKEMEKLGLNLGSLDGPQ